MDNAATPALAPAAAPVPPASRESRAGWIFKILYALLTGAFSAWFVSFTPTEGPRVFDHLPADADLVVRAPSGSALLHFLVEHPLRAELESDDDARVLVDIPWLAIARAEYDKWP